jgi:hypothetical protein
MYYILVMLDFVKKAGLAGGDVPPENCKQHLLAELPAG